MQASTQVANSISIFIIIKKSRGVNEFGDYDGSEFGDYDGSEIIEDVVDEVVGPDDLDTEDYPCEGTMKHWKCWLSGNETNINGQMKSGTLGRKYLPIDNFNGQKRVREFYAMTPEDAYGILEAMAEIHGLTDRLKKYEMNDREKEDEQMAQEIDNEKCAKIWEELRQWMRWKQK